MTNLYILVSRISILYDNEQISNDNLDRQNKSSNKTAKLKQNKTKDQTIQYGCLEWPSVFIIQDQKA